MYKLALKVIIKAQLARLPSKKVIWLVIVLVVLTIGLLWFVGSRTKKDKQAKLDRYYQEIVAKEKNLETAVKNTVGSTKESLSSGLGADADWQKIKINTSSASSTEALRQYGLDLGEALSTFIEKRESEVKATFEALDRQDSTELKKVVSSRLIHEKAINNLMLVAVPQELADLHRQLINNLQTSVKLLAQMEQALNNPELALEASRLFVQESILWHQTMNKISNYLSTRQVQFADNEKIRALFEF